MNNIDLVLLYVNPTDVVWQQSFLKYFPNTDFNNERFRDWGLFKYIFRGIGKCLPFINNVYLVVSNIEQVPEWVNQTKVHVVLHKDIIPAQYLPVFNSVTIEFFLYNIPGLSEHFIYANDDMYFINEIDEKLIVNNGKAGVGILKRSIDYSSPFDFCLNKVNNLIFAKFKKPKQIANNELLLPQHGPVSLIKSALNSVWGLYKKEILQSLTRTRDFKKDLSPALFTLYQFFTNQTCNSYPNFAYVDGDCNFNWLRIVEDKKLQYLCINDIDWSDFGFNWARRCLNELFETKFPEKSVYEK